MCSKRHLIFHKVKCFSCIGLMNPITLKLCSFKVIWIPFLANGNYLAKPLSERCVNPFCGVIESYSSQSSVSSLLRHVSVLCGEKKRSFQTYCSFHVVNTRYPPGWMQAACTVDGSGGSWMLLSLCICTLCCSLKVSSAITSWTKWTTSVNLCLLSYIV